MAYSQRKQNLDSIRLGNHRQTHQTLLPTLINKEQLNTIITNKDESPDHLAINIYLDTLCDWKVCGNTLLTKKIKTSGIYCNAKHLVTKHSCSKDTIRKKLVKLEKLGLIQRSFWYKYYSDTNTYNQRIIYVLKDTPYFVNQFGVNRENIKEIIPQTNADYIRQKYNISFASQDMNLKDMAGR